MRTANIPCMYLRVSAVWLSLGAIASADQIDFVRDVRPIFVRHCSRCHGSAKQKSGLRLDIKSAAFKGGDAYGPSIVPGHADDSPLIKLVRGDEEGLRMPPSGNPLTAAELSTLTNWINEGADWPAGVDLVDLNDPRDHWSFRPAARPPVPDSKPSAWPRNEIDCFVLERLEAARLQPAPAADRTRWLRRVHFDLTGLPPAPERVAAFVHSRAADAFEREVEELLASPRYGERWAQHWLDVVRYADTHGFEVNTERPHAWPYRDYVISAFNRETPYDQFIREQIVGDALGSDAATGFLVTASVLLPGQIGKDEPSKRLARQDALDEIVVNAGQTILGLSIGCARCHDHKFDPITQRDYYAMQAFFAGVEYADRDLHTPEAERLRTQERRLQERLLAIERELLRFVPRAGAGVTRPPVTATVNADRFAPLPARRLRFTILATNNREPCIDELEVFNTDGDNVALATRGTTVASSGDQVVANRHELSFIHDGRYGNSRSWMSSEVGQGWIELTFPEEHQIDCVIWGRDRDGKFTDRLATDYRIEVAGSTGAWQTVADSTDRAEFVAGKRKATESSHSGLSEAEAEHKTALQREHQEIEKEILAGKIGQKAFSGTVRAPDEIHRLLRGDPEQPQELVSPAIVRALGTLELASDSPEQERRTALAVWLSSPENPLTARVMVNRIWQGHFGTGLVDTPSDFGLNGSRPSHPELLDWLATEFVHSGWSVKHLHKLIVLSATYRQSSRFDPAGQALDADGRLLWRFPSRRLEAEQIRDAMLAVSGSLSTTMGGPGFDLFDKRGGLTGFLPVESFRGDGLRRMIYAHKVRRERDAVFGAFDCPDAGQSTPRRRESTTPLQALNLFNSRFTIEQATAFAARVRAETGNVTSQVRLAYRLAFSREPAVEELREAESAVREADLETLCRVLFNSNEFTHLP